MRLRTKLVLTATGLTFAHCAGALAVVSWRTAAPEDSQTASSNDVLANEVLAGDAAGGRNRTARCIRHAGAAAR